MRAAISAVEIGRKTPPTTPPLEFTELHRLPPLEIGPENSSNYPPPLEFTELHRLPPFEIVGPENYRPLLLDDLDPPLWLWIWALEKKSDLSDSLALISFVIQTSVRTQWRI